MTSARPQGARRTKLRAVDQAALASLHTGLTVARDAGDIRPPFAIVAECVAELGVALPRRRGDLGSLRIARDDWLRRLRSSGRSQSTYVAYRVGIDDLLCFLERREDDPFNEETIVAYLDAYRERAQPAPATYYRRFTLLRHFYRWVSRRAGVPDPFLDLPAPRKPQQEADWLTVEEFHRLFEAAASPRRNRRGLAKRDRLVLLTLVVTGLRRSELMALNWGDMELNGQQPSLLVRSGKGGRPRRQPLPLPLARELAATRGNASADGPVFRGLGGGRLRSTILANIIRRAATGSGIEKRVTAHTLRHTAATWLRQETGDARLVAAYLGHADLSTVSRYAHVATGELHEAAAIIAARTVPNPAGT